MKINVVFLCNSYPTRKNPHSQVFIKNMKEGLESNGLEVKVCYNKVFKYWKNAVNNKTIVAKIAKLLGLIFSILFMLGSINKSNVIFCHAIIFPTFYGVLLKKLLKKPLICYVHGGDVNQYGKKTKLIDKIMMYSLNNSDRIIANSFDIQKKLTGIVSQNKKVEVVSPGVNLSFVKTKQNMHVLRLKLNIPTSGFILLTAGHAIKRKGFDILLEAFLALKKKSDFFGKLIIISEGPERESYQVFVEKNNLADDVLLLNKVNQQRLYSYYCASDLFIFPSREEPLGLVGIEAMASGTIVIGSAVGGIKEVIVDGINGFLFTPNTPSSLAEKIYAVYTKKHDQRFLEANMKKTVKEHSLEASSIKLGALIECLVGENAKT